MRREIDYAYAVARIKAMENKLLKSGDIDALIDTDPEMLIDSLTGFGYPSNERVSSVTSDKEEADPLSAYTGILSAFFSETVRDVMSFTPEPDVLRCFLIPADYNNAKKCVKYLAADNAEKDRNKPDLSENGYYSSEKLLDAFIKKDFKELDVTLAQAGKAAFEELSQSGSSRNSDIILDKACFEAMAKASSSACFNTKRVMKRYLGIYADWKNLLASMRISASGSDPALFEKAYLPGNVAKSYYIGLIEEKTQPFAGTKYEKYVEEFLAAKQNASRDPGSIALYEQLSDAYIDGQLMKDRNEPYRINALLAYIAARKREISVIRLIVVGKRAGISGDRIREMIASSNFALDFVKGL
ncbi:MAG: V-type ATPase subunit [Clostridia bacterium]|nr:V-type ATPase subunit [Clostridia bacterium]